MMIMVWKLEIIHMVVVLWVSLQAVVIFMALVYLVSGLIKDRESMNQSGISLLQDLPLIGWLFRSEGSKSALDHVLVFVTPTRLEPFSK